MKKKYKHPSYYLISSAMDGDETAIEKLLTSLGLHSVRHD